MPPTEREDTTMATPDTETVDAPETPEDDTVTASPAEIRRLATQGPRSGPQGAAVAPISLFGDVPPAEVIAKATETAKALTAVLEANKLYKSMGTDRDGTERRHVIVEGWTLLGSMLGVFPTTVWTRQVADEHGAWHPPKTEKIEKAFHSKWCKSCGGGGPARDGCDTYTREIDSVIEAGAGGWEARVEAHTLAGHLVGSAEAETRWDESNWADRDSYALRSMAQTRATSKALRQPLGFIVELAGFRATPAEELDSVRTVDNDDESYTGPRCPTCESPVYDNRAENDKREEQGQRRRPEYKCSNKLCKGDREGAGGNEPFHTWDIHYFDPPADYTNRAKAAILDMVSTDRARDRFLDRYAGATERSHPRADIIEAALADPDPRQRAGILWLDVMDWLERPADTPVTLEDANRIVNYAWTALVQPTLDTITDEDLEVYEPEGQADDDEDPMSHYAEYR